MTEKRFTTVELPKPNKWGIWYDGACLSTYQVCILLNEYVDVKKENEQLKKESYGNIDGLNYYQEQNGHLSSRISDLECENEQLKDSNEHFKQWFKDNCITEIIVGDCKVILND